MTEILNDRFLLRGGLKTALASLNEVPLRREMIIELDDLFTTGKFNAKIGDGVTHYNDLPYLQTSGGIESLLPGRGINIDVANPKNPVVSSTLGSIAIDSRVPLYSNLPTPPPSGTNTYYVEGDKLIYIWDGASWPIQGHGISPSNEMDGSSSKFIMSSGSLSIPVKAAKLGIFEIDGTKYAVPCFAYSAVGDYDDEVAASAPMAYWKLDDVSGTVAVDSSGNGRDGTYKGNPVLRVASILPNGVGYATSFNGTDAYVDCGFKGTEPYWSIEAWIKPDHVPQSASSSSGPLYGETRAINYDHSSSAFRGATSGKIGGSYYSAKADPAITLANRYVVGTFDGTSLKFYVDGTLAATTAVNGQAASDTVNMTIAKHPTDTFFQKGIIQNVAYYGRALDATEVQRHWIAGSQ